MPRFEVTIGANVRMYYKATIEASTAEVAEATALELADSGASRPPAPFELCDDQDYSYSDRPEIVVLEGSEEVE